MDLGELSNKQKAVTSECLGFSQDFVFSAELPKRIISDKKRPKGFWLEAFGLPSFSIY